MADEMEMAHREDMAADYALRNLRNALDEFLGTAAAKQYPALRGLVEVAHTEAGRKREHIVAVWN